ISKAATQCTQQYSIFQMTLPANGAWRGYIVETEALKTGWAIINSDDAVSPVAIFSLNSRATGLVSEAAVFESPAAAVQHLFADTTARRSIVTQLPPQTPASDTGLPTTNAGGA